MYVRARRQPTATDVVTIDSDDKTHERDVNSQGVIKCAELVSAYLFLITTT